jgi:hypothetical protein
MRELQPFEPLYSTSMQEGKDGFYNKGQQVTITTGVHAGKKAHFNGYGKQPGTAVLKLAQYPEALAFKLTDFL